MGTNAGPTHVLKGVRAARELSRYARICNVCAGRSGTIWPGSQSGLGLSSRMYARIPQEFTLIEKCMVRSFKGLYKKNSSNITRFDWVKLSLSNQQF